MNFGGPRFFIRHPLYSSIGNPEFCILSFSRLKIQRALHFFFRFARKAVQVDHRRSYVSVVQERPDRAEVVTRLQEMGGLTVAEGVGSNTLGPLMQ
jgi:hypothetical protein